MISVFGRILDPSLIASALSLSEGSIKITINAIEMGFGEYIASHFLEGIGDKANSIHFISIINPEGSGFERIVSKQLMETATFEES